MTKIIIQQLSNHNLDLHLMANAGNMKNDVYLLYREFTGNIMMQCPRNDMYLMNENGDIPFIGNIVTLNNFINNLNKP
jgi:hypothetical protein